MKIKKIIILLSFFLLLGCGYEPIYSKKQIDSSYNLSINKINYSGDNKVNQIIKKKLIKYLNTEKKEINLNLNLNSIVEKTITSKNKKGDPITYSIQIIINLEIFEKEILKDKLNFKENFEYNNKSNRFDLKKYEKNIKNNLISKLTNNIIKYLYSLK